jgi:hypothetical protein
VEDGRVWGDETGAGNDDAQWVFCESILQTFPAESWRACIQTDGLLADGFCAAENGIGGSSQ